MTLNTDPKDIDCTGPLLLIIVVILLIIAACL